MQSRLFNLAGIRLKINSGLRIPLTPGTRSFLNPAKASDESAWKLKYALGKIRKSKNRLSINRKKKTLYYFKQAGKISDSNLLCYIYAQLLADKRGMLLHAAAVIRKKRTFLFFGPSGGGKSTVALISRRFGVLGDDVIALKKKGAVYHALSTPWKQIPGIIARPGLSAPVAALFFLKKSKNIHFEPVSQQKALARILSVYIHFLPVTSRDLTRKIFSGCFDLVNQVPAYDMQFSKSGNFWPKLEKALLTRKIKKYGKS